MALSEPTYLSLSHTHTHTPEGTAPRTCPERRTCKRTWNPLRTMSMTMFLPPPCRNDASLSDGAKRKKRLSHTPPELVSPPPLAPRPLYPPQGLIHSYPLPQRTPSWGVWWWWPRRARCSWRPPGGSRTRTWRTSIIGGGHYICHPSFKISRHSNVYLYSSIKVPI